MVPCHNFLSLFLCLNNRSKPRRLSKSVILLVDRVYAEATGCEITSCFISFYPRINVDFGRYLIQRQDADTLPNLSEFLIGSIEIPNFDIQYVEYYLVGGSSPKYQK
jgi:hypothetical protein